MVSNLPTCTVPVQSAVHQGNALTMSMSYTHHLYYCRAAVLTGRHQIRSGIYPKGIDPSSIGGTYLHVHIPLQYNTVYQGLETLINY